ncbi:MAG TPA: ATP-binding protein [Ktedonobacterales bacterium]|jgi:signal transduction histidine kinase|nr:ATP-binding protein [Ktedonobacterales bacterium]
MTTGMITREFGANLRATITRARRSIASLWLRATPLRAVGETLLLTAALIGMIALLSHPNPAESPRRLDIALIAVAWPVCALWAAIRMRLTIGSRWRVVLFETGLALLLGAVPTTIVGLTALNFAAQVGKLGDLLSLDWAAAPGLYRSFLIAAIFWGALSFQFLAFRGAVRIWLRWDKMRRTSLRWSLTHALMLIPAIGAVGVIIGVVALIVFFDPTTIVALIPIVALMAFLSGVAILVILPPAALFSWLFTRHVARRLQTLTEGTSALRSGEYGIRIRVEGADEVARLQADFNAMADALEQAMCDLRAERDNVQTLLRARRELFAGVSHELRTPVATLRGYLESAQTHWTDAPPDTLRHDLEVMESETARLQGLIDDLFTLTRAETSHLEMRPTVTDVGKLAQRIAGIVAPLAWHSNRVEVVGEVASDKPLAWVDEARLEQVVANLVHNGVRHTPPGGIVSLWVESASDGVTLQVRDTGEGIAAQDLPRIWDRFYRADAARLRPEGGSGLGLALVKELTEAMGGSVSVESVVGQGSCFTLLLPRAETGENSATQPVSDTQVSEVA